MCTYGCSSGLLVCISIEAREVGKKHECLRWPHRDSAILLRTQNSLCSISNHRQHQRYRIIVRKSLSICILHDWINNASTHKIQSNPIPLPSRLFNWISTSIGTSPDAKSRRRIHTHTHRKVFYFYSSVAIFHFLFYCRKFASSCLLPIQPFSTTHSEYIAVPSTLPLLSRPLLSSYMPTHQSFITCFFISGVLLVSSPNSQVHQRVHQDDSSRLYLKGQYLA